MLWSSLAVCEVTQSYLTLCDPMNCGLPGSSIHGIFQARILEWVSICFSRRSFRPRNWTWVSHIVGRRFTVWAPGKLLLLNPTSSSPAPLPSLSVNPIVWDRDNPSVASHHAPMLICLKNPSEFPSQPQYPISPKHQQGLKPIILNCYVRASCAQLTLPVTPLSYLSKSQMSLIAWSRTWDLSMQLLSPYTQ